MTEETGKNKRFCFDIDGTLCSNTFGEYENAEPFPDAISELNALFDAGHHIILFTARGSTTGIDWRTLTESQLSKWNVKYHDLIFGKPDADFFIDDRGLSIEEWRDNPPEDVAPLLVGMRSGKTMTNEQNEKASHPDYLEVVYDEKQRPQTSYPSRLADHLSKHHIESPARLLDIGCGRGDMMRAFAALGFDVEGTDLSPAAPDMCAPHKVWPTDLEKDPLPCPGESFDGVFSKSVIEHMRNPGAMLVRVNDALKPGGVAIIMTPSWLHQGWGPFYIDHTHVTPFTTPSLRDAMLMAGFENIQVQHFHQLPFLWKLPVMTPLVRLIAKLPLKYRPLYPEARWPEGINTFFRFSKEVMLLAVARKPGT